MARINSDWPRSAVERGTVSGHGVRTSLPMPRTYRWQTIVFRGLTPEVATAAFDEWFGYHDDNPEMVAKQPILGTGDGVPFLYLTHVSFPEIYEIHVTALMAVEEPHV